MENAPRELHKGENGAPILFSPAHCVRRYLEAGVCEHGDRILCPKQADRVAVVVRQLAELQLHSRGDFPFAEVHKHKHGLVPNPVQ